MSGELWGQKDCLQI